MGTMNMKNKDNMSVVDFQQLNILLNDGSKVLIDVRNEIEVKEDGKIPGSFILPLPDVTEAFQLEASVFHKKYGVSLPDKLSDGLILTCRSGRRSLIAKGQLEELGFNNIKVYQGSFLDWKAKGGHVEFLK